MSSKDAIPVTAVVVSCNDGYFLDSCLSSLQFCRELIVIDLQSNDDSREIAESHGATVVSRPKAPYVEINQSWVQNKVENDWILYLDPDESIDPTLVPYIRKAVLDQDEAVGQVFLPWKFYFKQRALKGTVWGGRKHKGILVNRRKVYVQPISQQKFLLKEGCQTSKIPWRGNNVIHHYWMKDFSTFLEKHKRYLKEEGRVMYMHGKRYNRKTHYGQLWTAFHRSMIKKGGYKDGFLGLALSLFWTWYQHRSWVSLRNYEMLALNSN